MALDWEAFPGFRKQEDADAMRESVKDYMVEVSRKHYYHVLQGGTGFVAPSGDIIPPVEMKAPTDDTRTPPLEGEALDVFLYWPPPPPEFEGKKRPVLLLLHGSNVSKDEQGLAMLGSQAWFLDRLPKEVVVVIPQCPSRARRPWVQATVKATLNYAVQQAIENGGDPDRVYVTGVSMGGIGVWELAMDAAEGKAPYAAAVPLCGMILNTQRLPSLVDYPLWCFHGANDMVNPCQADDEAIAAIVAAGANQGAEPTLRYTRYHWCPGEVEPITGFDTPMIAGHACQEVAWADEEMWTWLFQQRRDPRRFAKRSLRLRDGRIMPGGQPQGLVEQRRPTEEHLMGLIEKQAKHLADGSKDLLIEGRRPIPPICLQGERDEKRKPPLEPAPLDFFISWPPKPEKSTEEKRPVLLYLHGGYACQEEGGMVGLAAELFWLPRVPEDMVVLIPQTRSRKHHWMMRNVKATLLYAIDKVIKLGVDPDRVYVTGISMGGTAAFEFALDSAQGKLPFAASIPVTPYVMSIHRSRYLANFPMWVFYGSNEWDSLVARVDDAMNTAVDGGANRQQEPNLLCTKYAWAPDTSDPGMRALRNSGHGTYQQAYTEPELWGWLLSQRKGALVGERVNLLRDSTPALLN